MCQEQGEGLSVEHGVRDHVDGGTGCVRWDTSLPLHTVFLIAELLRPLPGSHWVRRVRKSQGMGALLHQTAQNDFPGGVTGLTSPSIPGPHAGAASVPPRGALDSGPQREWDYDLDQSQGGNVNVGLKLLPE